MDKRRSARRPRHPLSGVTGGARELRLETLEDRWTPTAGFTDGLRPHRAFDAATSLYYSLPTPTKPVDAAVEGFTLEATTPQVPGLTVSFDGIDFNTDASLTGSQFIPAGPSGATGPNHVVGAVNGAIRWSNKTGGSAVDKKLGNSGGIAGAFFDLPGTANDPTTALFSPKVTFDQSANRFVVVAMEQTTSPTNESFLFVAVSQTADPNGAWNFARISSKIAISGVDTWADAPGVAVDGQAIYVTTNQFTFGNSFLGNRLFIVPKGIGAGGIYDLGGSATFTLHDPPSSAGAPAMTYAPAQMFGTAPAGVGTWLVAYSAMSDGSNEFMGVIRVDNPLAGATFSFQLLNVGNIDDTSVAIPQAPQSGSATLLDTGNDACLQAVWRNNNLYATTTVVPQSGVDVNQATAHWWRLNTTTPAALAVAEQGNISGNDIAAATHTFFPSVAVDSLGNLAFSFSASAATIFPGAYYTGRESGDLAGTVQPTGVLKAGIAFYVQTLGTGNNRWGGYSSAAVDPVDGSFWLFNQYAQAQAPSGTERGRWGTRWGRFAFDLIGPTVVSVGPVSPDPRNTPVPTVNVTFSEPVRLTEFTTADLTLTRNGGNVTFSGNESFTLVSGNTYQIGGLDQETALEGDYVLTVNAATIPDNSGNFGTGTGSVTFVIDLTPPTIVAIDPVSPNPRATPVGNIGIKFSELIDPASFDISDLTLTRNGVPVTLSGNETVTLIGSSDVFDVAGLAEETATSGNYVFGLDAQNVKDLAGNTGLGADSVSWTTDATAPAITGLFFDGTAWTTAFRTAAGSTNGFPAQTGASQLVSMPWSTVNLIRIRFSENVSVQSTDLGVRGINVANYTISNFAYSASTFIATWTVSPAIDTDRIILDLDGDGASGVVDTLGNKMAGTWNQGVSTFPTTGAAAVDFKFRFVIAVGDANRDGLVRNADTNLVRANLFVDAGSAGYSIFTDITADGLTRNADTNVVRSHLFVDPPAGPGPFRPVGRTGADKSDRGSRTRTIQFAAEEASTVIEVSQIAMRRSHRRLPAMVIDEVFGQL